MAEKRKRRSLEAAAESNGVMGNASSALVKWDADRAALGAVRRAVSNLKRKANPDANYIRAFIETVSNAVGK